MRTDRLGSLEVSVIGLGCNNFGRALDQAASKVVVDTALEAGINVFDAADSYGEGRAESYLAAALGDRRHEVVIATKFGNPISGIPDSGGASPVYIRRALERSLRELATDYIDLYYLHRPDPTVAIEDTMAELNDLADQGKVREVACSNFETGQMSEAATAARELKVRPFVANQVEYSLLHRVPETDGVIEVCEREQVALLPYYPLKSGFLTGKARRGEPIEGRLQMDRYQSFLTDSNFDKVEAIRTFASGRGVTMVQVALGWLLAQPAVPFVTAGATRQDQIAANVAGSEWMPTIEDLTELDLITMGSRDRPATPRPPPETPK